MKTIFKWLKRIVIVITILILLVFIVLWFSFYSWKNNIESKLPGESKILQTAKGPIEYIRKGDSKDVILIFHGTPGSYHLTSDKDYYIIDGYSILSFSRPGYFRTPISVGKTPGEQADASIMLLDSLGIDSVFVVGISGGGPASVNFALHYPKRCRGLILTACITQRVSQDKSDFNKKSLIDKFFSTEFGNYIGLQLAYQFANDTTLVRRAKEWVSTGVMLQDYTLTGWKNDDDIFLNLPNYPLENISVPTLIMHGDKDVNVPFVQSQDANRKIANSELFVMDGKDHFGLVLNESLKFRIHEFLDKNNGK